MAKKAPYWGNNLQEELDRRDMSVSQFAELAGVTPSAVYQWMSKEYPTLTAEKAAAVWKIFRLPHYKVFPLIIPEPDAYDTPDVDRVALAGD